MRFCDAFVIASDLVMVRCIMLCIVMLTLPSMTLQKAQGMICGFFFRRRGFSAVKKNERNIIKKYMIHI